MSYNTARPYLACFIIFRKNGKIACLLRENTDWMNGYYALPAGKAEIAERAIAAAVREAKEEVGVVVAEKDLRLVHVSHRKADDDTLAWMDFLFEAEAWQGELTNTEPHKHSELAWLDPANLPENIIPSLKYYLERISIGLLYSEYAWEAE